MKQHWIAGLLMASLAPAALAEAELPRHAPVPGGVAVIELESDSADRPTVRYRDREALVVRSGDGGWRAVLGIPLNAEPGRHSYRLEDAGGEAETRHFRVDDKAYKESRITITDENMVTPDEEAMERIRAERPRIREAQARFTPVDRVPLAFHLPVQDRQTSAFGLKRFINDEPRNPHSGLDIAGNTGTAVQAPAAGEVIETGHFYFNGKTVFLDHGRGLISIFSHLDSISVDPGERLEQGDQLGTVGMTGRVTGPHLHWSVSLNNTKVNPRYFLVDETPLDEK